MFAEFLNDEVKTALRAGQGHVRMSKIDKPVLTIVDVKTVSARAPVAAPTAAPVKRFQPVSAPQRQVEQSEKCGQCQGGHNASDCAEFKRRTGDERLAFASAKRLC